MSIVQTDRGFTIVEVLMFLAVTGVLIMVAMSTIGGSREKAEFSASVRDFNSSIQAVINEVKTGYFPVKGTPLRCRVNPADSTLQMTTVDAPLADQGAHPECVFLGKVLHFGSMPSTSATVVTVAGKAFATPGNPPTTYAASKPKPVAGSTYSNISLNETLRLTSGLQVTGIFSSVAPLTPNAFGIFNDLTATEGSLSTNAVTIPGSTSTQILSALYSGIVAIGTVGPEPTLNPVIAICLRHGTGGKRAVVIIGSRDRSAYSVLHIDDFAARLTAAIPIPVGVSCSA